MTEPIVPVALIGCGYWGKNLLRCLDENCVMVCDPSPQAQSLVKDKAPWAITVPAFDAVEQAIDRGLVQAVCIATPPSTHYRTAQRALRAGAHVFVEKPLTLSVDTAEDLALLAEQGDRVLMVGHLLRYHRAFVALKEMVDGQQVGRLRYIYSNRLNLGKVRAYENVLWSFAPHDVSMILALMGDRLPERVFAQGSAYLQDHIPDVTVMLLDFGDVQAHIFVSWLNPIKQQELVVCGERRMVRFCDDGLAPMLRWWTYRVERNGEAPTPVAEDSQLVDMAGKHEPLQAEVDHFLACCRTGQRPLTDGAEAVRVLRVLEAGQTSLEIGLPVEL